MEQTERKTALDLVNERIFTEETLKEFDDFLKTNDVEPKGAFLRSLGDARSILKSHIEMINEELARR